MEIGCGIDHVGFLDIAFQLLDQTFLFGDIAHKMELVVLGLQTELFPDVKQVVEGIVGMTGLKRVAVLETVLLETEQVDVLTVEISVEFIARTCETALVKVMPYGSASTRRTAPCGYTS